MSEPDPVDPTVASPPSRPGRLPVGGVVGVGLLLGMVVGLVAAWALQPEAERPTPDLRPLTTLGPETPEAAEAFIDSWERSRRATYLTITEWHRVTTAGAELRQVRVFAQRPPDRIRLAGQSVSGVAGGVRHTCDELEDDHVECRAFLQEQEVDFDAVVEREVELMWRHVEGTHPLYRVSQDGDCFMLRLARGMVVPPYGTRTTYCFDPESGAVSEFRIERHEGTDTERLLWVDTEVSDEDLDAVADGSYRPPEDLSVTEELENAED